MHRMFLTPVSFLLAAFLLASQPTNTTMQPSAVTTAQDHKPEHPEWSPIAAPTGLITG